MRGTVFLVTYTTSSEECSAFYAPWTFWAEFSVQGCMICYGHRNVAACAESSVALGAMGSPLMAVMLCVILILGDSMPSSGSAVKGA